MNKKQNFISLFESIGKSEKKKLRRNFVLCNANELVKENENSNETQMNLLCRRMKTFHELSLI